MTPPFPMDDPGKRDYEHIDVGYESDGKLLRIALARPKANILDAAMIGEIRCALESAAQTPSLRAILFDHEGPHFSYGASVEEHLPDQMGDMLGGFHGMFRDLMSLSVPTLAAVRGQSLGAGCELASFCHRVFVAPDAHLGQPEIKLAVFAPVASIMLPTRMGQAAADDVLLSGRSLPAEEAVVLGLADEVAEDPTGAARAWFETYLADKSATTLQYAVRAARFELHERMRSTLDDMERLYISELMTTRDALEGLNSFLEKRRPQWSDG